MENISIFRTEEQARQKRQLEALRQVELSNGLNSQISQKMKPLLWSHNFVASSKHTSALLTLKLGSFIAMVHMHSRFLRETSLSTYKFSSTFKDSYHEILLKFIFDRTIALAVSRRLPTAAARVRAWIKSCGICGGQSGNGAGFLRVLRFPMPHIPPTASHSSSSIIIRDW
jgi:hypothetical protein